MIAYLTGTVLEKSPDSCIIFLQGIGYEVFVPLRIIEKYATNDDIKLHIFHRLKEDSSQLFGFEHRSEKKFFKTLLSVSGVGPKTAIAMLEFPPKKIIQAIETEDIAFITQVPGLGKKTASRLILEIKGKLPSLHPDESQHTPAAKYTDIIAALEGLGFEKNAIATALQKIPDSVADQADEKIIKWSLKQLSS